jgi:hypothetical protein
MEVNARMFPRKEELVPSVAELPTCQNTLHACAPPRRLTLLLDAVTSVDAIWKMKTPLGSACASSVRVPVIWNVPDAELYTPGTSVCPPSCVAIVVTGVRPAASLYAVTRSFLAPWVTASPAWFVPVSVTQSAAGQGVNPVSLAVGNVPTSPVIVVAPVFVRPEPPRTAKLSAVPRPTGG